MAERFPHTSKALGLVPYITQLETVVHTCNPSTSEVGQEEGQELKVILGYTLSPRVVCAT